MIFSFVTITSDSISSTIILHIKAISGLTQVKKLFQNNIDKHFPSTTSSSFKKFLKHCLFYMVSLYYKNILQVLYWCCTWRSLYTGHVDVHMISKTGGEKGHLEISTLAYRHQHRHWHPHRQQHSNINIDFYTK